MITAIIWLVLGLATFALLIMGFLAFLVMLFKDGGLGGLGAAIVVFIICCMVPPVFIGVAIFLVILGIAKVINGWAAKEET